MDKTSLGDRMKQYEAAVGPTLLRRTPVVIRVDGKAFHTFTKKITNEIDPSNQYGPSEKFHDVMMNVTQAMCQHMQNVVMAYTQSDEISFLLRDWDTHETQQWYGGKTQKIISVSAAMAASYFNYFWEKIFEQRPGYVGEVALFDSRAFNVPKEEVTNYFIWRQQDATRNSINSIARKYFSHKQLHMKNVSEVQDMLMLEKDVNWNEYHPWKKRGACVIPNPNIVSSSAWEWDECIPIFTQDREYIEKHLLGD